MPAPKGQPRQSEHISGDKVIIAAGQDRAGFRCYSDGRNCLAVGSLRSNVRQVTQVTCFRLI